MEIKKIPSMNWIYSIYGSSIEDEYNDKDNSILNVLKEMKGFVI
jgi:hypothetical protein